MRRIHGSFKCNASFKLIYISAQNSFCLTHVFEATGVQLVLQQFACGDSALMAALNLSHPQTSTLDVRGTFMARYTLVFTTTGPANDTYARYQTIVNAKANVIHCILSYEQHTCDQFAFNLPHLRFITALLSRIVRGSHAVDNAMVQSNLINRN